MFVREFGIDSLISRRGNIQQDTLCGYKHAFHNHYARGASSAELSAHYAQM
jgi:hypothetical protein